MTPAERRSILLLNTRNKRETRREAKEMVKTLDARTALIFTTWAQEEFTTDTILNEGVIEEFFPFYYEYSGRVELEGVRRHVREVVKAKIREYSPLLGYPLQPRLLINNPLAAHDFMEKLVPSFPLYTVMFEVSNPAIPFVEQNMPTWTVRKQEEGFTTVLDTVQHPFPALGSNRAVDRGRTVFPTLRETMTHIIENW